MKFKNNFLTLSMREQICIVIIILSFLSFFVILCLSCSFCYEILKEDYKQKKIYFYDRYKEFIEASFYFQHFCLLQYEEIIKRMQLQLFKYHRNSTQVYTFIGNNYISKDYNKKTYIFNTSIHKNISENNEKLFILSYDNDFNPYIFIIRLVLSNYIDTLSSLIFTHDIDKSFRVPGYNIPIFQSPLVICPNYKIMASFNGSLIYQTLREKNCNYTDGNKNFVPGNLDTYYNNRIQEKISEMYASIRDYFVRSFFLFAHIFEKATFEITFLDEVQNIYKTGNVGKNETFIAYLNAVSGYYSSIHLENNKFELISFLISSFYYFEADMIPDYLFYLHNSLANHLNISFIPIYKENNTIISTKLCLQFLLKQYNYELNEEQINVKFNELIKGVSNITDCFIDKNIFKKQQNLNNILDINISNFLFVDNLLYQGIIDTGKYPYYYIKYSFPNYNSLKEFRSDYLLLDQVNFYLFISFKEPILFSQLVLQINKNLFYLIVIIVLYTWIVCSFVNLLIFNKVIVQLIEPILKLQEAIESSSIKDDNIFKYEYDDFISDLFLTSKELLNGQINNSGNGRGLNQINIISKSKKNNIKKNEYQRNLIINNDIMNQLISEQQNMMDFSKNIQINYLFNKNLENNNDNIINTNKNFHSHKIDDNKLLFNLNDDNNKDNIPNKNKKYKSYEEKNRLSYKKLFQISEYLFYYQNKVENNYIHLVNNLKKDERRKSNISNIKSDEPLNISTKSKKTINLSESYGKNDDKDNIKINMLRNKNISYLWYMEAKKKMNKSLNYKINTNYDELFNDFNIYN